MVKFGAKNNQAIVTSNQSVAEVSEADGSNQIYASPSVQSEPWDVDAATYIAGAPANSALVMAQEDLEKVAAEL